MSSFRVLVVDDFEPFLRFICSILRNRPEFQIVGETSDGLDAVHKSESLQPDLIVLDLALPTLNGIEAARRIRTVSPKSKILFVSQESSAEVVQEALSLGAMGYVVKAHAGSELLAAVEAVRQGRRFISAALPSLLLTDNVDAQGVYDRGNQEAPASLAPSKGDIRYRHEVHFYPDDASFVDGFARFIEAALLAGNAVIVVATDLHRGSLLHCLQERGVNISAATEERRYLALDVGEILSSFMANDLPDPVRFLTIAGDLVNTAGKAANDAPPRVAISGECSPVLWMQGKAEAAIQLEHLWDEIAKTYGADILCGYVLTAFQRERESQICSRIGAEHSTAVFR